MPTVAVLEAAPRLAPLLARALSPSFAVLSAPDCRADLLVLAPELRGRGVSCPPCPILLLPGRTVPPDPAASLVVSYGPSPRDTLTFSSLGDGEMVLALQRELVTLTGRRLERQELALTVRWEPMLTLAWAGTLLLAGAAPERLPGLARRALPITSAPPAPEYGSCGPRPPRHGGGRVPGDRDL